MKETLCWSCRRPGTRDNCSWDRSLTPVEGWDAEPTRVSLWPEKTDTPSFCVRACPLFLPMDLAGRELERVRAAPSGQELALLLAAGWTDEEIARSAGVKIETIRKKRRELRKQIREAGK